jgi:hypothetical protein
MTKPRPTCVHCGAEYGRRDIKTEVVIWRDGEMPPYRGNSVVIRTYTHHGKEAKPQAYDGVAMCAPYKAGDRIAYRDLWDGETWTGGSASPFCTLRCAHDYAVRAWRTGRARP